MNDENNDENKKKNWKEVMDEIDKKRNKEEFLKKNIRSNKRSFGERHKGTPKGTCIMCGKRVSPYARVIQEITNLTYCRTCAKRRGII